MDERMRQTPATSPLAVTKGAGMGSVGRHDTCAWAAAGGVQLTLRAAVSTAVVTKVAVQSAAILKLPALNLFRWLARVLEPLLMVCSIKRVVRTWRLFESNRTCVRIVHVQLNIGTQSKTIWT